MAIYLIRHGETASNRGRVLQTPDVPLNEHGLAQAERLGERLTGSGVVRILSSDHTRAAMTAAAISKATHAEVEWEVGLQERSFGDLRGRPYSEIDGDLFAPDFEPPGGESWADFHRRVAQTWERIVESWRRAPEAQSTERHLAIVTHGLVCRVLAERHFLIPDHWERPRVFQNTSLTIVSAEAPFRVELLNCCQHLDDEATRARAGGAV